MGPPVNAAVYSFYEWLFVVLGPALVVCGVFGLFWGYWAAVVIIVGGLGMTLVGWSRLIRFVRSRD